MVPDGQRSAALDLGTGALLAAAIAVVAEARGHTVGLVLRTVRESGDGAGLVAGGVTSLSLVLVAALASRRDLPLSRLVVVPAAACAVVLFAAKHEGLRLAASATPALTMAERQATLALAWVRTAGLLAFAALVASWLLVGCALVAGWRARPRGTPPSGRRRVAALVAGIAALVATTIVVALRGRAVGWAGASAAGAGVLAVFHAAQGVRSAEEQDRRAAEAGICEAAVLSLASVACAAVARALVAAVGLGDEGPADWPALVAMMRGRMIAEGGATLWFVGPVGLAWVVTLPPRAMAAGLAAARPTAACACVAVGCVLFAPSFLQAPATALAAFAPTLTPSGFEVPQTSLEGDCAAMEETRVVFVGADRIHVGAIDVAPASALDSPAGCDAFVAAHAADAPAPWIALDATAPFAHAGCLLGALGRARGERVSPGTSGRFPRYSSAPQTLSPCATFLVARAPGGGEARCPRLALEHPYCSGYRPEPRELVDPEHVFDVVMTDPSVFRIRIAKGTMLLEVVQAPRHLARGAAGRAAFSELQAALAEAWRRTGDHAASADRKVDFALLHAAPETPVPEVVAALEAMGGPHRDMALPPSGVRSVPVFDVGLAPLEPPRARPSLAELADGPGAPRVSVERQRSGAPAGAEAVVVEHVGALRACAAGASALPELAALRFRVDPEGFADAVQLQVIPAKAHPSSTAVDADLASCVGRAIASMPFDATQVGRYALSVRFSR